MGGFSYEQLGREARREIKQRERVYPNLVVMGRMVQAMADERIAMMEAMAKHFERLAQEESGQASLFDERRPSTR